MASRLRNAFLAGAGTVVAVIAGRLVYDLVDSDRVWHDVSQ